MSNDKNIKKALGWTIGTILVVILIFGLQIATGAMTWDWSNLISILIMVAIIIFARQMRVKKLDQPIKDERTSAIGTKANAWTLFYSIYGCLLSAGIVSAFTPFYPEFKWVSMTLLVVAVLQSILSRIMFWWWERKMS